MPSFQSKASPSQQCQPHPQFPPLPSHFPFHSTFTTHPRELLFILHSHRHSALVVQSVTPNGPSVTHSLAPPAQHHTTTSIGSTLHPTSSLLSASSGHSGPTPSQLSLHNPATASVSSVGNYTVQRDEVRKAWVDVEGEVTVSMQQ